MFAEPWVAVDGVARHLGVSHDALHRWINGMGLPTHKLGRLWKFKRSEGDDWVGTGGARDPDDDHLMGSR